MQAAGRRTFERTPHRRHVVRLPSPTCPSSASCFVAMSMCSSTAPTGCTVTLRWVLTVGLAAGQHWRRAWQHAGCVGARQRSTWPGLHHIPCLPALQAALTHALYVQQHALLGVVSIAALSRLDRFFIEQPGDFLRKQSRTGSKQGAVEQCACARVARALLALPALRYIV